MLWLRIPQKVYFKKGSMPVALDELGAVYSKKKAFIVTDTFLYKNGNVKPVEDKLNTLGIQHTVYFNVEAEPTLTAAQEGAKAMLLFEPDVIIAVGGGSAIDAAKVMRVLYEHPETDFADLVSRFSDIRSRKELFPKLGAKAYFAAIPTTSGTGSEVSPFAVITDESTDKKYTLADYALLPDMAVVDADYFMEQPKELTVAVGLTALVHSVNAYVSEAATEYTDGFAIKALENIFTYLPSAYKNGADDPIAREKLAEASTMAGIAFANAYNGISGVAYGENAALELADNIRKNAEQNERYQKLADIFGIDSLADKISELIEVFGIR